MSRSRLFALALRDYLRRQQQQLLDRLWANTGFGLLNDIRVYYSK